MKSNNAGVGPYPPGNGNETADDEPVEMIPVSEIMCTPQQTRSWQSESNASPACRQYRK